MWHSRVLAIFIHTNLLNYYKCPMRVCDDRFSREEIVPQTVKNFPQAYKASEGNKFFTFS